MKSTLTVITPVTLAGVLFASALAVVPPQPSAAPAVAPAPDTGVPPDPIARLQQQINSGALTLAFDSTYGFLPSLLKALDIPISSQGLVFSRTSLQTDKIAPWAPRALYYNDDVYIGYVQESHFLEIASMHPTDGAVFYTLNQLWDKPPAFQREGRQCLMCHESRVTEGVPGLMTLSTIADRHGYPITGVQDGAMSDATPLAQRFGGWYVTGSHGTAGHSGNVRSTKLSHEVDKARYRGQIDLTTESTRADLTGYFDSSVYPSAHSDLVALMVLVHQTVVHNLVTIVHAAAREADRRYSGPRDPRHPTGGVPATPALQAAASRLVQALFFDDEAPLNAAVQGSTTFAAEFTARGPRDSQGRSLREFDLQRRLFKYPLSFLVYSDGIRHLPPVARQEVHGQIAAALDNTATNPLRRPLDPVMRDAIAGILRETFPELLTVR